MSLLHVNTSRSICRLSDAMGGAAGVDGRLPEVVLTGGKVVLPAGMLVQLVVPQKGVPSFWDLGSEAERCRLCLASKLQSLLQAFRPSFLDLLSMSFKPNRSKWL